MLQCRYLKRRSVEQTPYLRACGDRPCPIMCDDTAWAYRWVQTCLRGVNVFRRTTRACTRAVWSTCTGRSPPTPTSRWRTSSPTLTCKVLPYSVFCQYSHLKQTIFYILIVSCPKPTLVPLLGKFTTYIVWYLRSFPCLFCTADGPNTRLCWTHDQSCSD